MENGGQSEWILQFITYQDQKNNNSYTLSGGLAENMKAIGLQADIGEWSFRAYWTWYGDQKGFDDKSNKQRTGGLSIGYKDFYFRIENDLLGVRGEDRWRSSAVQIGWKDLYIGTYVYNNDPDVTDVYADRLDPEALSVSGKPNNEKSGNTAFRDGQTYQSPIWIGMGSIRYGISDKLVQDKTQNWTHRCGFFGTGLFGRNHYFNKYAKFEEFSEFNIGRLSNPFSLFSW